MPVIVASQLSLRARFVAQEPDLRSYPLYFWLRVVATAVAYLVIVLTAVALGYRGDTLAVIGFVALGRCAESLSDIAYASLHRDMRLGVLGLRLITRSAIVLAFVVPVVLLLQSVLAAAIALAAACLTASILDLRCGGLSEHLKARPRIGVAAMYKLTMSSIPLSMVQVLVSIVGNLPRYFMDHVGGQSTLGQYSVLEHFVAAGAILVNSAGQASMPALAAARDRTDPKGGLRILSALVGVSLAVGAIGIVASSHFGTQIVEAVYGPSYDLAAALFPTVMLAALIGFVSSPLGYALTAYRCDREQLLLFVIVVGVALAANYSLAPSYGPLGVVWSSCIANGVQLLGSVLIVLGKKSMREAL